MRGTILLILIIALLNATLASTYSQQTGEADAKARAQKLLNQAREALGGEAKLEAIKSFSAAGKYRRVSQFQGQSSISEGEIGFDFLLPDKFLKTDTRLAPSGDKMTRLRGVNGDKYFQDSISSNSAATSQTIPSSSGPDPKDELRAECARYLLAWLLTSSSSLPLEFSYAGEAKTKDGIAEVLVAKGPHGFAARLLLDQQTHRPVMLSYRGKAQRAMTITGSGNGPINLTDAIKEAERQASKEEEIEMQFSEYRAIDGLLLPHRIKQRANGEDVEEWILTKFQINPPLKPEKFQKK